MGASDTNNTTNNNESGNTTSDVEAFKHQLKVSSTWVNVMLATQLFLSACLWYNTSFWYLITHSFFVFIGIAGVARKARGLIFTHFVYTSMLTFFLLFILGYLIIGRYPIPIYAVPFGLAYLLIQSIGIRHQRALFLLISLEKEMSEVNIESGLQKSHQTPVATYDSEEQQPFLVYNQQPLTEEEEMQQIIAAIKASEQQVNVPVPVPSPVPAAYASTMPQYPFVFPQQQPFVYSPYQVNPVTATEQNQVYYPSPMMYPGTLPQPYHAMMVMMPPTKKQ